ncbi:MAG: hypothetical protein K2H47_00495 [Muribaculaceae bacterium]|nr:hypothetical protein [Muribaculaceae bacterium]
MKIKPEIMFRNALFMMCAVLFVGLLTSCSHSDEPEPINSTKKAKRTVVVYAIASNNLWSDFRSDRAEMLRGLENTNLDASRLLVYWVSPTHGLYEGDKDPATGNPYPPALYEVKRDKATGDLGFVTLKTYSRSVYSTDPKRMSDVIADAIAVAPAEHYGLVLWSHGLGWLPASHRSRSSDSNTRGGNILYSFGYDEELNGIDEMDIDELAAAIPNNVFDYIWFDACYMTGIETVYQLRHKCETLVGYPTEIWSGGMPYDIVIETLMSENPDLIAAANKVFDHYALAGWPATASVISMAGLEQLADAVKNIYEQGITLTSNEVEQMQYYSRNTKYPFYDLGQYALKLAEKLPEEYSAALKVALDKSVIYKAITPLSFDRRPFNQEVYSGLSTHIWRGDNSEAEKFYSTLDWYKRVY